MTKKDKKKYSIWAGLIALAGAVIAGFRMGWFGSAIPVPVGADQKAIFDAWKYYGRPIPWDEVVRILRNNQEKEKERVGDGGGYVVLGVNITDSHMSSITGKPKFFSGGNPQIQSSYPISRR